MRQLIITDKLKSHIKCINFILTLNVLIFLQSTFDHLSKSNEVIQPDISMDEARTCQDLLSQAKYHLDRAKSREEQERIVRKRQEEEREIHRKRQLELQEQAEQIRLQRERRLEVERGRFLERAKQISIEPISEVK